MGAGQGGDPLRRGDQAHLLDARRAPGLEDIDRGCRGAAGRQHRIEDEADLDGRRIGQLVVVLDRLQGPLVAIETDVPDLGRWHQLEHRLDHAQARPQHRDEPDLGLYSQTFHRLERRLDRTALRRKIGQRLVADQPRQLTHQLAELLGIGVLVTQQRELVADEGVIAYVEVRVAPVEGHRGAF